MVDAPFSLTWPETRAWFTHSSLKYSGVAYHDKSTLSYLKKFNTTLGDTAAFFSNTGVGAEALFPGVRLSLRNAATSFCMALWRVDYLNDWRELKLEREVWRSIDSLASARGHLLFKKKYYSTFYEPTSLVNKVST